MQGSVTLIPTTIPHVMLKCCVLFSIHCLPLGSPCNFEDHALQDTWEVSLVRAESFSIPIVVVRNRHKCCSTFMFGPASPVNLWSVLFRQKSLTDHLRPSDARAQICLDAQHDVQVAAQQRRTFALRESV